MTKKEKEIIRKHTQKSWDNLKRITSEYGIDSEYTVIARSKWAALDDLWAELFFNEDYEEG